MANRVTVYPTQVPFDTDVLSGQKNMYIGLSKLAAGVLGKNTLINGFAATATPIPSLAVSVGEGEIYSLQVIDNTAYGSLPADTTHSIVKQGISLDAVTLSTPAPLTVGYSINYLVQVSFNEADTDIVSRPYFNSADPTNPLFQTLSDSRQDQCVLSVKAGIPASTGTQVTPAPDSGYFGVWVVTVAYGQTTVTSGNIVVYPAAPFIGETLTQKISQAVATSLYSPMKVTTSGSVIVPLLATKMFISGVGTGGGGGGAAGLANTSFSNANGGGGGGGCGQILTLNEVAVVGGETITMVFGTPGVGGTAGASGGGAGGNGGTGTATTITGSFGTVTLAGGAGGDATTYSLPKDISQGGQGGANGGFTGGQAFSQPAGVDNTIGGNGGNGANSPYGVGGIGAPGKGYPTAGINGGASYGFGSGGAGGSGPAVGPSTGPAAGGAGSSGANALVILTFG